MRQIIASGGMVSNSNYYMKIRPFCSDEVSNAGPNRAQYNSVTVVFRIPFLNPSRHLIAKVKTGNNRTRYEICSNVTTKPPQRHHWYRCGVFIVYFEPTSNLVLVYLF